MFKKTALKKINLEKLTILVTGGAGFIGSKVCKELLDHQAHVICFDNFSTGSLDAIESFSSHPNFRLIGGDIRDSEKCEMAMNGVDYVFHLAGVDHNTSKKIEESTINNIKVDGFLNVLSVFRDSKVKGLLYKSSIPQSHSSIELPTLEEVMKGKPLSSYVISKYTNELYANLFRKKYSLQIQGVEFSPIYDKTNTKYVSKIIELNIDALNKMLREEYLRA